MGEEKQAMNKGPYAIITGASQGLGKAFAMECAKRKMNLVLTSLPGEQLTQTALFISETFAVTVVCYEADLSSEDACYAFFNFVEKKALRVNMLINNAGIGSAENFGNQEASFYELQVKLNVLSPVLLTRLFLPGLQREDAAFILNVSSLANFFYIPGKEVYGASKSFLYSFSKSLRNSLRNSLVKVSVVCPGGINTNERVRKSNEALKGIARKAVQSPEVVAAIAIRGLLAGKAVIVPGKINRLTVWLSRLIPGYFINMIIANAAKRQSPNLN